MSNILVRGEKVRIDKNTGYICITDISKLTGDHRLNIPNWMRAKATAEFINAWELKHNPHFSPSVFEEIVNRAGSNSFYVSVQDLSEAGCVGAFAKRGRSGGTYCAPLWAVHFANWLDAAFYVETLDAYLEMQESLYGKHAQLKRFARELAAENLRRPTSNALNSLPPEADVLVERRFASIEADLLNLALWGMTAQEWRIKFPQSDQRKNMRDYATVEELKALASLEMLSREMQEDLYTTEERLKKLRRKATEYIQHYCNNEEKQEILLLAQHKRGWGRFEF